jgi:hypothetical protein
VELIQDLEATRDETLQYFNLSEKDLARSYAPGKWSVRILHHLADSETVYNDCIRRALSEPDRYFPNTAQKVLTTLIERRLLEARPGIGTTVATWRPPAGAKRRAVLTEQLDRLVVEAKHLGLGLSDVVDARRKAWK